jgi:hypothetical protein
MAVLRIFDWLALLARSDRAKDAGILLLRHQLAVLQHSAGAPRLLWADRAILAALARLLPRHRLSQLRLIVSSRTLLRWHADLVRRYAGPLEANAQPSADRIHLPEGAARQVTALVRGGLHSGHLRGIGLRIGLLALQWRLRDACGQSCLNDFLAP